MNPNQQEHLAIQADQEEVAAMLSEVSLNRTDIGQFLDSVGPAAAFMFSAWFVGQLIAQDPEMLTNFRRALEVGIQVGGVMRAQHDKDNPGFDAQGSYLILYPPPPSNESQLSLINSTDYTIP